MCGPSRNRKQEAAVAEQNRIVEEQRLQAEKRLADQQRIETERSNKITGNVSSIEQAFAGFDDPFFAEAGSNIRDFFVPQLNQQFGDAQKQATFDLANQGLSDSSVAADKAGELKELFDRELQGIESKANTAEQSLRGDVSARESNLRRLAEAGTSLDSFQSVISPEVSQVNLPTNFSALGDIFGSAANNFSTLQKKGAIPTFVGGAGNSGANPGKAARVIN